MESTFWSAGRITRFQKKAFSFFDGFITGFVGYKTTLAGPLPRPVGAALGPPRGIGAPRPVGAKGTFP